MLRVLLSSVLLLLPCLVLGQTTSETVAPETPAIERDLSLYRGDVAVSSESVAERRGAIGRALVQVLVRLSGDRLAALSPVVRKSMASAEGMVVSADYRQDSEPAPGGGYRQVLQVQFDASAMDALIAAAGLRYWSADRPQPMLWLAINDGRGPRLVSAQQLTVVRPLALRGLERGLRFGLPAGSSVEQAAVDSVWAQNAAAIANLSAHYQRDAQLLGKLYRDGSGGWTGDWLLTQAGAEVARWSLTDADPQRVIAEGADGAADALAKRDSVMVDAGPAGERDVLVAGIASAEDYTRAMGYLQNLAVVRGMQVLEANEGRLRLRLDLAVGEQAFSALVGSGATLQATTAEGEVLVFQLGQ